MFKYNIYIYKYYIALFGTIIVVATKDDPTFENGSFPDT